MNPPLCGYLDEFLNSELSPLERAAFEEHLEGCVPCRQATAEQRRIEQLLRRAVAELEPVPVGLTARLQTKFLQRRMRRRSARVAALAAAVFLSACGLGWWMGHVPHHAPETMVRSTAPTAAPVQPVQAEVEVRSPGITVPVASHSPRVTIVWVYEPSIFERKEP